MRVPGREVIQADDFLIQLEQRLEQVRSYESGDTGYQPPVR